MFRYFSISRFRGFRELVIKDLDRFNLILGRNNVGKTAFLESVFLLMGPTNPELPLRINILRGIDQFKNDAEDIWGWLFYDKNVEGTIHLMCTGAGGKSRSLTISLKEPTEIKLHNGAATRKQRFKEVVSSATTATTRSDLILQFKDESGAKYTTRAFVKDNGLGFDRKKNVRLPSTIYVISRSGYSSENAERFSKLEEAGKEAALLPALQVLEPRLKRLAVLVTPTGPMLHGDIGLTRMVPLPFMGEGIGRLLTLLLAMTSAKNGLLLVDEIETGIHYSAMTRVWTAVAQAAREFDVQLLATSHSWECLKAAHESFAESTTYDLKVHRLDRIKNDVECVSYDRAKIEAALNSGLELR